MQPGPKPHRRVLFLSPSCSDELCGFASFFFPRSYFSDCCSPVFQSSQTRCSTPRNFRDIRDLALPTVRNTPPHRRTKTRSSPTAALTDSRHRLLCTPTLELRSRKRGRRLSSLRLGRAVLVLRRSSCRVISQRRPWGILAMHRPRPVHVPLRQLSTSFARPTFQPPL